MRELIKALLGVRPQVLEPLINAGALLFAGIGKGRELVQLEQIPPERALRFAALCYLSDAQPEAVLRRLKSDKQLQNQSKELVKELRSPEILSKAEMKARFSHFPLPFWSKIIAVRGILLDENTADYKGWFTEVTQRKEPYCLRMLDISGFEIKSVGFEGVQIGEELLRLYRAVIKNPEDNRKELLIERAKEHFEKKR